MIKYRNIKLNQSAVMALLLILTIYSCNSGKDAYQLTGIKGRKPWFEPVPFGMNYIEQGSFRIGPTDHENPNEMLPTKVITINSFWIDDTEITNNEYRQFTRWVLDSIAMQLTIDDGSEFYCKKNKFKEVIEPAAIDWDKRSQIWNDNNIEIQEAIEPLYYSEKDRLFGKKSIDTRKLYYQYSYIDFKQAAKLNNQYNYSTGAYEGTFIDPETGEGSPIADRSSFFITKRVMVYPDTLCWIRDYTFSFNDPWTKHYFNHVAFDDYPVVGVAWEQAKAFCHWRTRIKADFLKISEIQPIHPYRLPTEAEWEFAARGGQDGTVFPWGSYYSSTCEGCYLANFKPLRGNYVADSKHTAKSMEVGTYEPNDYGLYDMAGNVAEWTSTAYHPSGYDIMGDWNPNYEYNALPNDPPTLKRKVIRGGSWKDIAHYLKTSTRDFEYQDSSKSYIGFRCVMTALEDRIP